MGCPRQYRLDPQLKPNDDHRIMPMDESFGDGPCAGEMSLVEELGEVADELRQLATDFGARPYRVFSVVVRWSAGEVGRGDQEMIEETEFLPTPEVDLSSLRYRVTSGGKTDDGSVKMYGISPRYTEDEVRMLFWRQLRIGEQQFIEVRLDARFGRDPVRHRFTLQKMPIHDATGFQWVATLFLQQEERNRNGTLSERETVACEHPLTLGGPEDIPT